MKKIPNLQFNDKESTVSLLTLCLNFTAPGTGMSLTQVRARNRVADAIEKVKTGDTIQLEDADYATAKQCIMEVQWIARTKHLITFAEQFGC